MNDMPGSARLVHLGQSLSRGDRKAQYVDLEHGSPGFCFPVHERFVQSQPHYSRGRQPLRPRVLQFHKGFLNGTCVSHIQRGIKTSSLSLLQLRGESFETSHPSSGNGHPYSTLGKSHGDSLSDTAGGSGDEAFRPFQLG